MGLPSGFFPSGFPNEIPVNVPPILIRATLPAHLDFLDFITRNILGEH